MGWGGGSKWIYLMFLQCMCGKEKLKLMHKERISFASLFLWVHAKVNRYICRYLFWRCGKCRLSVMDCSSFHERKFEECINLKGQSCFFSQLHCHLLGEREKLFSIYSSQFLSWVKRANSCPFSTSPITMKWYNKSRNAI